MLDEKKDMGESEKLSLSSEEGAVSPAEDFSDEFRGAVADKISSIIETTN